MRVSDFVAKWAPTAGSERSNAAPFLVELCDVLGVERPVGVTGDAEHDVFVLEHRADVPDEDGPRRGRIDLYKKGCFILEAKQGSHADGPATQTAPRRGSYRWTQLMRDARGQAEAYARGLEAPPPFLIVVDVGYAFDLYACFDGTFRYRPFPDPPRSRLFLKDLPRHLDLLRLVFTEPMTLDPAKRQAQVTKDIAAKLAELARALEEEGHDPELVARFLMRCIFTMFAEDVGLLPERIFTRAIEEYWIKDPSIFASGVESLWHAMNDGGNYVAGKLLRFNGGLFRDQNTIPLNEKQLLLLLDAARRDWSDVEPAIFGTLLERALDKKERHQLGAHFTPRAYVERLVRPTIEEPLRDEWGVVQVAVRHHIEAGNEKEAKKTLHDFHRKLCSIRVLDPACGSGNFLYVALDLLKQLEAEVLSFLRELGESQELLDLQHVTVTPEQFLGIEVKEWAKEIAELVLWIGYLRWHFKARGEGKLPPEPVLQDYENIECRDAVLAWDGQPTAMLDDNGRPVTRWDGEARKEHPATGELVPDETARVPVYNYRNPRRAEWPLADFVVGNPPFIGASNMRRALGDGYVEALRRAWQDSVPESADFVMYWWHMAAERARSGALRRFGLITTNSVRQTFNRRVVAAQVDHKRPLSLVFAIPDHPWVDSEDGAAVRIAMTVAEAGEQDGLLQVVQEERDTGEGARLVHLASRRGRIHADLTVGANVTGARQLRANGGISSPGVKLHGSGFIVAPEEAAELGLGTTPELQQHIRQYRNGRDLTKRPRGVLVIDLFGLGSDEVRRRFPAVYQWVHARVKPERDQNNRAIYRDNWWLFGEPRREWRQMSAGLRRYIATVETMKHRLFLFLGSDILPDNKLVSIALDDAVFLGVLSSRVHATWAMAAGGWLGVGNDSVYVKTRCFEAFPFPEMNETLAQRIRDAAEELDSHRARQLRSHEHLNLTSIYNVIEKLRRVEPLTPKEQTTYNQGLVSVLRDVHDSLDRLVLEAYGWRDLADALVGRPGATAPMPVKSSEQSEAEGELLRRLVALNIQRSAEESSGLVRWLRPAFQSPEGTQTAKQTAIEVAEVGGEARARRKAPAWPKDLEGRIKGVRDLLLGETDGRAWSVEEVAASFRRARRAEVKAILEGLAALGYLVAEGERYKLAPRTAA